MKLKCDSCYPADLNCIGPTSELARPGLALLTTELLFIMYSIVHLITVPVSAVSRALLPLNLLEKFPSKRDRKCPPVSKMSQFCFVG